MPPIQMQTPNLGELFIAGMHAGTQKRLAQAQIEHQAIANEKQQIANERASLLPEAMQHYFAGRPELLQQLDPTTYREMEKGQLDYNIAKAKMEADLWKANKERDATTANAIRYGAELLKRNPDQYEAYREQWKAKNVLIPSREQMTPQYLESVTAASRILGAPNYDANAQKVAGMLGFPGDPGLAATAHPDQFTSMMNEEASKTGSIRDYEYSQINPGYAAFKEKMARAGAMQLPGGVDKSLISDNNKAIVDQSLLLAKLDELDAFDPKEMMGWASSVKTKWAELKDKAGGTPLGFLLGDVTDSEAKRLQDQDVFDGIAESIALAVQKELTGVSGPPEQLALIAKTTLSTAKSPQQFIAAKQRIRRESERLLALKKAVNDHGIPTDSPYFAAAYMQEYAKSNAAMRKQNMVPPGMGAQPQPQQQQQQPNRASSFLTGQSLIDALNGYMAPGVTKSMAWKRAADDGIVSEDYALQRIRELGGK